MSRDDRVLRQKHADESVAAGREYVTAYVEFIHYVEQLHLDITGAAGGKEETETAVCVRPGSR